MRYTMESGVAQAPTVAGVPRLAIGSATPLDLHKVVAVDSHEESCLASEQSLLSAEVAPAILSAPPALDAPGPADARDEHDPYRALRYRDFRLLAIGRFVATLGQQMLYVAIGYEIYLRTHSALALGYVGLAEFLPVVALLLPAGQVADHYDRRLVALAAEVVTLLAALGLAILSYTQGPLPLLYGCILAMGAATAFGDPASTALVSQTVPTEVFGNAATWTSSSWQLASVVGPALGGVVIAVQGRASLVYVLDAVAALAFVGLLALIRSHPAPRVREVVTARSLVAGVSFIWQTKIILAAITLDLFAVLLGGATTLLPIFALTILHVGAVGLGLLRAAPSVGALAMALAQAHLPPLRRSGHALLWAVAGFGVATIAFGLSRSFLLSLVALMALGAFDNISVIVRSTLMLTRTPDAMRGRASAVNSMFVGASNELGGFESGLAAALFGPVISVVAGGLGVIAVVGLVALFWPEIRRLGRLGDLSGGSDTRLGADASSWRARDRARLRARHRGAIHRARNVG